MAALCIGLVSHLQKRMSPASLPKIKINTTSLQDVRTLCKKGCLKEALSILNTPGSHVDSCTYVSLLQACMKNKTLSEGKRIHAHINNQRFKGDNRLWNALINMYVKCGSLVDARRVFNQIPNPDVCSWTMMIAACSKHGDPEEALTLFYQMQPRGIQPNQFTFASVLPACASLPSLDKGMDIHQEITRSGFQSDAFVMSGLVDMYAKCGSIEKARELFDKMSKPDMVAWTAMIAGYAKTGHLSEALMLFRKMPKKDVYSWTAMISGYAQNGLVDEALKLFEEMPQRNVVSWNAMIAGFARNGRIDEALKLFKEMPQKNAASWNAMIAGFMQNGFVHEALKLFKKIPQRTAVSWNAMIAGLAQNGLVDKALELFHQMPQRDVFAWTAIVSGFAQSGLVERALKFFNEMPQRTVVSWNAMIAGFGQNGYGEEALMLFREMQLAGVSMDYKTFASILLVCANLAAEDQGMEIHEKIIRNGFQSHVIVVNALIDMYVKCGSLEKARELFDHMHHRDVVSWTTMIGGYAMHGCGKEALKHFEQMKRCGVIPDHITLVCVLSACSHAGLVDEGYHYFNRMRECYHITPSMEHYNCMVDLLGRAGRLYEAQHFINNMPIKPDATVWSCLLGACRMHNNLEMGEYVAERTFELDSKNSAPYLLILGIYAAAGRWDSIKKVREMMKERRVEKTPGCSWIDINKQVHAFIVADRSHLHI